MRPVRYFRFELYLESEPLTGLADLPEPDSLTVCFVGSKACARVDFSTDNRPGSYSLSLVPAVFENAGLLERTTQQSSQGNICPPALVLNLQSESLANRQVHVKSFLRRRL